MSEILPNLVLEHLRAIREEQAVTSAKIGTLAESMVSMNRRIDDLTKDVHSMRTDVRMIAIAVDEHSARLDRIAVRLNLHDA